MIKMSRAVNLVKSRAKEKAQVVKRQKVKSLNSQHTSLQFIGELNEALFVEMLRHAKVLIQFKGGCSGVELRRQFQNVPLKAVQNFIAEATKRGMIKEDPPGTFVLQ